MIAQRTEVLARTTLAKDVFRLDLKCAREWRRSRPGQFLMLGMPESAVPLLRRPFSIHRLFDCGTGFQGVSLLVKSVGPVTRQLSTIPNGAVLDLLGPLGKGFQLPEPSQRVVLAAGGIGAAPLVFLLERIRVNGLPRENATVFLGGRSRDDLVCRREFEALAGSVHTTTDDGSDGDQCRVTDPLQAALEQAGADRLYVCGPEGMLQCVAGIVRKLGITCQMSLETVMACGMGVCLGCAVPKSAPDKGYWHTCIDGPVFDPTAVAL